MDKKIKKQTGGIERDKQIDVALKEIEKRFGKGNAMRLDRSQIFVEGAPTGLTGLDYKSGIGGLSTYGMIEIFGPEGAGKTTLTYTLMAAAQKQDKTCLFIDTEHRCDPNYAAKLGVEFKKLIFSQPRTGEMALEILAILVDNRAIDMAIIDSLAGLVPKAEVEGYDIGGQKRISGQAAMMSQSCRILAPQLRLKNVVAIFTNQTRSKIGGWGNPETTPGGNAMKFWASMRLRISKGAPIKQGERQIGHAVKIKFVKNNLSTPYTIWEGSLLYGKGFDSIGDIIWIAKELGILIQAGSYYKFNGETLALGYDRAVVKFKEDPNLFEECRNQVMEKLKNV